ncbi:hypothetical protein EDC17_101917 [Sphingobacterium alimentarium]|uniref:Uncharacterized protein n=1 Tax=Sphingobacterium alimentarium TaxID=797292 RepID=A0A4R3VXT7_9SPHI|nr:hypothetical protein [Sphingobacterium alimentarium]TCV13661.1 hypothetical protein EDC17_101917 [Sphingobacterium alimentarium]
MRLLIYFMCLIFTFVSIGGNIYIHKCEEATLLSIYEKVGINSCPFCAQHHQEEHANDSHCAGECKDDVLPIDQLSHTELSTQQAFFAHIYPAIIPLLWITAFPTPAEHTTYISSHEYLYAYSDSSPPIYLLNRIFRI